MPSYKGTTSADFIKGSTTNDVIEGLDGNDSLYGEGGADTMKGGNGNDHVYGGIGDDSLYGDAHDDYLEGGAGNDALYGGSGNDSLYGGIGKDRLEGGTGNDTYYLFDGMTAAEYRESDSGLAWYDYLGAVLTGGISMNIGVGDYVPPGMLDTVTERANEGIDTVAVKSGMFASIQWKEHVENLRVHWENDDGTSSILWGNEHGNSIWGGKGSDEIDGRKGNDKLYGGAGNDKMWGAEGNDELDGGAGADQMAGGVGNDTYYVDSASDVVTERAGEGTDTIHTSLANYTVAANVENLWYTGTASFIGQGNAEGNQIVGGFANDWLYGFDGNDNLIGGVGDDMLWGANDNDTLEGEWGNDTLYGANGIDTLKGGSGNDTMTGGNDMDFLWGGDGNDTMSGDDGADILRGENGNDTLNGGAGADLMYGGAGDDVLTGGAGADTMDGGAGKDRFVWTSTGESAGANDRINGFEHGIDKLDLSKIDARTNLAGDQAFVLKAGGAFSGVAGELIWKGATAADGSALTQLLADVNGDKVADMTIEFAGVHSFTTTDFLL
ncbi:MAG: hypothetical protein MUC89_15185 [Acetobacteraceae bacterium]|jgi:Ca2+-binding RTX toxin-like protein|nr:hypothetical protein [Acetobacteraceae bacterium]